MQEQLQRIFHSFYQNTMVQLTKKLPDRDKMGTIISNTKGQVLITSAQIEWTSQMTQALIAMSEKPELNPLKKVRALYKKKTELYVECVEKPGLNYRDRQKIIALIIIEEHNREVIEKIAANKGVNSENHFEWQSQLRFFKDLTDGSDKMYIKIEQLNARFDYGYEY